jgi:hypothetical protein
MMVKEMAKSGFVRLLLGLSMLIPLTLGGLQLGLVPARAFTAPTLDGKLDDVYRAQGAVTRYSDSNVHAFILQSDVPAATLYVLEDATYVYIFYHQDRYYQNDLSYGDNQIHWENKTGERGFNDIEESDMGEFVLVDSAGGIAAHFHADQIEQTGSGPSGHECLGFGGGDGQWLDGYVPQEDRDLIQVTSSMAYNLNRTGYCSGGSCSCGSTSDLLTTSPLADGAYRTTEQACSDWQWYNGWEMRIAKSVFQDLGFGVVIGNHHNSPHKMCAKKNDCPPDLRVATSAIGNRVWYDVNRDGLQQSGEPGLSGVTVNLIDARDGRLIESRLTGAGGDYLFDMLSNEHYIVQVDESTLPAGFSNTNHEVGDFKSTYVNDVCGSDCLQRDGATYDRIYAIDLEIDQDYRAADFGYAPGDAGTAVIGDTVWSDADDDGIQDRGEPGIGGVALQLLADNDDDGVFDDLAAATTTGDDGAYFFINVAPGTYVVKVVDNNFDPGAALDGYAVTAGPHSPGANVTTPIDVAAGDAYLSADFGYYRPNLGAIGNYVWYDVDGDGEQDIGEDGAENVTLDLYLDGDEDGEIDGGEAVIATDVTDAAGGYAFVGLKLDQHYLVTVSDRNGVLSALDVTTYWGDDSICTLGPSLPDDHPSCDPIDLDRYNVPVPVHLTPGLPDWPWADVGYNGDGSIGDLIWYDWFENGVQDAGEIGVTDVELRLLVNDKHGGYVDYERSDLGQPYTVTAGALGGYLFTDLPADNYQVQMTLPLGYRLSSGTPDNPHDSDGVALATSQSYRDADFGLVCTAQAYTIGDAIWYDANADSAQDSGESGIADVTLALYEDSDGDGVLDATEPLLGSLTTDENGNYTFYGAVDGGHYLVTITDKNGVLAGYEQTAGLDPWSVTISGANRDDVDFGYVGDRETATLGDTVWYDATGDGSQGATERGIANVAVELYRDNGDGNHGAGDSLVDMSYTDADGRYLFTQLSPGTYFVHVVNDGAHDNFAAGKTLEDLSSTTGGETTAPIVLSQDEIYLDADFGYRGPTYTIGDTVWSDADDDGIQDAGELGIGGVTVELLDGTETVVETTTTFSDGWYLFTGLLEGSYKVRVSANNFSAGQPLEGYTVTSGPHSEGDDTSSPVSFSADGDPANDTILRLDFGYHKPSLGTIGDYVWLDKDLAGDQDPDEPGLAGVTLDLIHDQNQNGTWDAGEPIVATSVTNSDGIYQFVGLDLDDGDGDFDYLVRVSDRHNVLGGLSPTTGTVNPRSVALSAANSTVTDADFGYDDPELGDRVWHDADQDGIQDGGECGIGGVTVLLYHDADGDGVLGTGGDSLIRTTTTNVSGHYYFGGLPFDDYILKVADSNFQPGGMLEGFNPSPQDAGGDDALDSDGDGNHEIATTPLSAKDFTLDFGFQGSSYTIGDLVWEDADKDGQKGGSEIGLDGVTLVLYRDLDGDGVQDPQDGVLGRTTTAGGGAYAFPNLPDGRYIVRVTDENGVLDGYTQTAGGDPQAVTVSGADVLTVDFGYMPLRGGEEDNPTGVIIRDLSAGIASVTPTVLLRLAFAACCATTLLLVWITTSRRPRAAAQRAARR